MAKNSTTDEKRGDLKQRGDPTGQWRAETEVLEAGIVRQAAKAITGRPYPPNTRKKRLGADPYNNIIPVERRSPPKQKRRSLDDMRRLSEEIKAAKKKGAKLAVREVP